jgi:uncharacterized SAM-binding protein YcdF (DUF218 family)
MRGMLITAALALVLIGATLPAVVRQFYPPLPAKEPGARPGAVVVLGAGRRVQGGLREAWQRDLPIVLSGGAEDRVPEDPAESEAGMMEQEVLRVWPEARTHIEPNSRSTWENARNTAALLRPLGVQSVVLVTDRAHMPRAILCFQRHGLRVEAVALESLPKPAWAPSAGALSQLPVIWREWAALIWYHLRYFR